jgi:hypothetical protein
MIAVTALMAAHSVNDNGNNSNNGNDDGGNTAAEPGNSV